MCSQTTAAEPIATLDARSKCADSQVADLPAAGAAAACAQISALLASSDVAALTSQTAAASHSGRRAPPKFSDGSAAGGDSGHVPDECAAVAQQAAAAACPSQFDTPGPLGAEDTHSARTAAGSAVRALGAPAQIGALAPLRVRPAVAAASAAAASASQAAAAPAAATAPPLAGAAPADTAEAPTAAVRSSAGPYPWNAAGRAKSPSTSPVSDAVLTPRRSHRQAARTHSASQGSEGNSPASPAVAAASQPAARAATVPVSAVVKGDTSPDSARARAPTAPSGDVLKQVSLRLSIRSAAQARAELGCSPEIFKTPTSAGQTGDYAFEAGPSSTGTPLVRRRLFVADPVDADPHSHSAAQTASKQPGEGRDDMSEAFNGLDVLANALQYGIVRPDANRHARRHNGFVPVSTALSEQGEQRKCSIARLHAAEPADGEAVPASGSSDLAPGSPVAATCTIRCVNAASSPAAKKAGPSAASAAAAARDAQRAVLYPAMSVAASQPRVRKESNTHPARAGMDSTTQNAQAPARACATRRTNESHGHVVDTSEPVRQWSAEDTACGRRADALPAVASHETAAAAAAPLQAQLPGAAEPAATAGPVAPDTTVAASAAPSAAPTQAAVAPATAAPGHTVARSAKPTGHRRRRAASHSSDAAARRAADANPTTHGAEVVLRAEASADFSEFADGDAEACSQDAAEGSPAVDVDVVTDAARARSKRSALHAEQCAGEGELAAPRTRAEAARMQAAEASIDADAKRHDSSLTALLAAARREERAAALLATNAAASAAAYPDAARDVALELHDLDEPESVGEGRPPLPRVTAWLEVPTWLEVTARDPLRLHPLPRNSKHFDADDGCSSGSDDGLYQPTAEQQASLAEEGLLALQFPQIKRATRVSDDLVCEVCSSGDDETELLVCDGCSRGFHMRCLAPPLAAVPEGDWLCAICVGFARERFARVGAGGAARPGGAGCHGGDALRDADGGAVLAVCGGQGAAGSEGNAQAAASVSSVDDLDARAFCKSADALLRTHGAAAESEQAAAAGEFEASPLAPTLVLSQSERCASQGRASEQVHGAQSREQQEHAAEDTQLLPTQLISSVDAAQCAVGEHDDASSPMPLCEASLLEDPADQYAAQPQCNGSAPRRSPSPAGQCARESGHVAQTTSLQHGTGVISDGTGAAHERGPLADGHTMAAHVDAAAAIERAPASQGWGAHGRAAMTAAAALAQSEGSARDERALGPAGHAVCAVAPALPATATPPGTAPPPVASAAAPPPAAPASPAADVLPPAAAPESDPLVLSAPAPHGAWQDPGESERLHAPGTRSHPNSVAGMLEAADRAQTALAAVRCSDVGGVQQSPATGSAGGAPNPLQRAHGTFYSDLERIYLSSDATAPRPLRAAARLSERIHNGKRHAQQAAQVAAPGTDCAFAAAGAPPESPMPSTGAAQSTAPVAPQQRASVKAHATAQAQRKRERAAAAQRQQPEGATPARQVAAGGGEGAAAKRRPSRGAAVVATLQGGAAAEEGTDPAATRQGVAQGLKSEGLCDAKLLCSHWQAALSQRFAAYWPQSAFVWPAAHVAHPAPRTDAPGALVGKRSRRSDAVEYESALRVATLPSPTAVPEQPNADARSTPVATQQGVPRRQASRAAAPSPVTSQSCTLSYLHAERLQLARCSPCVALHCCQHVDICRACG